MLDWSLHFSCITDWMSRLKSLSAGVFLVVSSWEREKTSHIRQYIRKPEEDDDYDGNAQKWIPTLNFRHQGIETKKNTNCFTVLYYAPLHSSSNKKNFSIFRKDDICILVSSYLYSRQFFKNSSRKIPPLIRISLRFFWWVQWSETHEKYQPCHTMLLHISYTVTSSSSQKMPNFSLEKLHGTGHKHDEKIYQKEGNFRCWWSLLWLNLRSMQNFDVTGHVIIIIWLVQSFGKEFGNTLFFSTSRILFELCLVYPRWELAWW